MEDTLLPKEVQVNTLFPIFLKLEQLQVLLVGGGNVGLEKLNALLSNSPSTEITVVAKTFHPDLIELKNQFSNVMLHERAYNHDDLDGKDIVIVAANDIELAQDIKVEAEIRKILINVADTPDLCDFYLGSIVKKGDLKIAISTNGKSPTMAKRVREVLDDVFPSETQNVLDNLHTIRNSLKGDFAEKVKHLNEVTSVLVDKKQVAEKPAKSKKLNNILIYYLPSAIALMVLGHLLFMNFPLAVMISSADKVISQLDSSVLFYILAGFTAQMIDGALGMAYGLTATSFLLSLGVPPAASSASVHASEIFTSGVSGLMHLKFGNVNNKLFRNLLIPGVIGAILGAYVLSSLDEYNNILKPLVSTYTLILGVVIIFKALKKDNVHKKIKRLFPLALVGGFLDSIGGGGWGPVVSSTLIAGGRNARYTIGSVNLAEFFVALASSLTFVTIIGLTHWAIIAGLVIGGVIAAPIAAYLSSRIPTKTIMILVGVVVIIASLKRIFF